MVSIHAPARGATRESARVLRQGLVSIHAPARGATSPISHFDQRIRSFNSRAREGRDRSVKSSGATIWRFNSRAREGRDNLPPAGNFGRFLFQFTRPRGARRLRARLRNAEAKRFNSRAREGRDGLSVRPTSQSMVSIHAPARGATSATLVLLPLHLGFNSRAREGRDVIRCTVRQYERLFQFTRPRGARQARRQGLWTLLTVSIHAPARGATPAAVSVPAC